MNGYFLSEWGLCSKNPPLKTDPFILIPPTHVFTVRKGVLCWTHELSYMTDNTSFRGTRVRTRFGLLTLISFCAQMIIILVIASGHITDAQELKSLFKSISNVDSIVAQFVNIFPNNLRIASFDFIPVLSTISFIGNAYNTGVVLATLGTEQNVPGISYFVFLAQFPDTFIEIYAYAISFSCSIYVPFLLFWHRNRLKNMLIPLLYVYLFVVLELAIAAFLESIDKFRELQSNPQLTLYNGLLWIPGIISIISLYVLFTRILHLMDKVNLGSSSQGITGQES